MAVAGTLVVERILDVAVLTALLFLGLLGLPAAFPPGFVVVAASLAGGGIAVVVLPLLVPVVGRVWERLVGRPTFGWRWTQAVSSQGALLIEALRLSGPRTLLLIGLSAAAPWRRGSVPWTDAVREQAEQPGGSRRHPQHGVNGQREGDGNFRRSAIGLEALGGEPVEGPDIARRTGDGGGERAGGEGKPRRARGLLPVLGRRESSAPPTIDRPSAAAIRAGTAGEARCER